MYCVDTNMHVSQPPNLKFTKMANLPTIEVENKFVICANNKRPLLIFSPLFLYGLFHTQCGLW